MASNKEIIWNYLFKQGLSAQAVFGIMGNMQEESRFLPNNLQDSYEKRLGFNNETYTAAVDSGAYKDFDKDKAGYGTCQWTSDDRKKGLLDLARQRGKSIGDLNLQLDYLMIELNGPYSNALKGIKAATTIRQASDIILTQFERPADQSESAKRYRAALGEKLYEEYKRSIWGNAVNPYKIPTVNVAMARDEVRWIQYQLNAKGYNLSVDGIWGSHTEEMVRAFQADNGLVVDGICGPATRAKLEG